ncbi:MAG: DUF2235 domain-containing protein [Acetobacteraceae bacterium]|nr:DUF2235 domain-containing protein [Acetobacteraceae bacterium]
MVCCDGTANEFREHNTNVVRLYQVLLRDRAQQLACYHPGLGTIEAAGAVTSTARWVTKQLGKMVGYGLESDLRDLYVFLMRHYEPGDRLFLFGFSRGAYTVRALVGLLQFYGLMGPENEPLVPYAIRRLVAASRDARHGHNAPFKLAEQFKATFGTRACKPHFVGVWDTVSSVGWIANPLRVPGTTNSHDVATARHALALDERRAFFRTNRWNSVAHPPGAGPGDLKEVWFAGVHSDVGGGYSEKPGGDKRELWRFSLGWMLREAERAGLLVDDARKKAVLGAPADPNAGRHESLVGWWHLAEFVPRRVGEQDINGEWRTHWRMNLYRPRIPRKGDTVHWSVLARAGYGARVPPNHQVEE